MEKRLYIQEIADAYELWGSNGFVPLDNVYDMLESIQAYCNGIKPIVYCNEMMGQLLFSMQYNNKQTGWRGFTIKKDSRIPNWFIIIYSKKNRPITKQPRLWSMVIQFNECDRKDKDKVVHILLDNLKCGVDV